MIKGLECLEKIKNGFGCDPAYYGLNREFEDVKQYLEILDVIFRALEQGYIYNEFDDMGFLKWNVTNLEYFDTFEKFALVNINGVSVGLASGVNGTYAHLKKDAFFLDDYKKTWFLREDRSE